MKNIRFFKLKHNNVNIILGYCNYKDFEYCCSKVNGSIILTINKNYKLECKRKIIHKVISDINL